MSKITKCTSIEWLVNELKKSNTFNQIMHELGQHSLSGNEDIIAKAKQMERDQIEDAVSNAISKADMIDNRGYFNFDKWYKETYRGQDE
jgi:hypothetical protein